MKCTKQSFNTTLKQQNDFAIFFVIQYNENIVVTKIYKWVEIYKQLFILH